MKVIKHIIKIMMALTIGAQVLSGCAMAVKSVDATQVTTELTQAASEMATELLSKAATEISEQAVEKASTAASELKEKLSSAILSTTTDLEEVSLVYVVDGDTLVVTGSDGLEYKVRLIGVDTPESVHSDASRNNEFGESASTHTKELLHDVDTLYLEYDTQVTDKYNRTLAYVWLTNDTSDINNMLNARILSDGYAVDKVYEPNHRYAEHFAQICQDANDAHAGLWQTEGYHALVNR